MIMDALICYYYNELRINAVLVRAFVIIGCHTEWTRHTTAPGLGVETYCKNVPDAGM